MDTSAEKCKHSTEPGFDTKAVNRKSCCWFAAARKREGVNFYIHTLQRIRTKEAGTKCKDKNEECRYPISSPRPDDGIQLVPTSSPAPAAGQRPGHLGAEEGIWD